MNNLLNRINNLVSYGGSPVCTKEFEHESPQAELLITHQMLHEEFGEIAAPPESILDAERELSMMMRRQGIEHRHSDALAKVAGTVISAPRPPTLEEVSSYMGCIGLDPYAVFLARGLDDGKIFIYFQSPLLKQLGGRLLKAINRNMPPGVVIEEISKQGDNGFAETRVAYQLKLLRAQGMDDPQISTWEHLTRGLRQSASAVSAVFKRDSDPLINFRVLKSDSPQEMQHIVTGAILEPGVPDGTRTPESDADIYSEEEITQGMYWWMENANHSFTHYHLDNGGKKLSDKDVVLLENWQTRQVETIGEQVVPKGTWMATARIKNDDLWKDILTGKIKSWSIGAEAMAAFYPETSSFPSLSI